MPTPEEKLSELGLTLPAPLTLPPELHLPFTFVNVRGDRAFISGHPKQTAEGAIGGPFGQVGTELTTEEAQLAARDIGLSVLANLKAEIGELSRVSGWLRVFGMVNSAPGFNQQTVVINGFSQQIIEIFGPESGMAARSGVGMAQLPFSIPVEVEAELELHA